MNLQRGTVGVLLVEDELMIACMMEDMLRELGFSNIHVESSLLQEVELMVSPTPSPPVVCWDHHAAMPSAVATAS